MTTLRKDNPTDKRIWLIGNWKMNLLATDAQAWIDTFLQKELTIPDNMQLGIAPPTTLLQSVVSHFATKGKDDPSPSPRGNLPFSVWAQNCHDQTNGAFTGETSPGQVIDTGATGVILGHSERRHLFGESDTTIHKKLMAALQAGLSVILCVGETEEQRSEAQQTNVVTHQISTALSTVPSEWLTKLIIAYEPVWAIGTGKTATPEIAQSMHQHLRQQLINTVGTEGAAVPIVYGGSVKPTNVLSLMQKPDIDGALIGGASLKADSFAAIIHQVLTLLPAHI